MKEYTVKGIKVEISDNALTSYRFVRLIAKAASEDTEPLARFNALIEALEFLFGGELDRVVDELEKSNGGELLQVDDLSDFFAELMNTVAEGKN